MKFTLKQKDSKSNARAGVVETEHGKIETPIFMPVGTSGSVKGVHQHELENDTKAQIILGNTYHLYLRPGIDIINEAGGLHNFSNWTRPMLTDSGGFQVFSLAKLNKISDEGVEFQSHLDGSYHSITPEVSMEIQRALGSDIIMAFDHCPPGKASNKEVIEAVDRTNKWFKRCKKYLQNNPSYYGHSQTLFPIIQGGVNHKLRKISIDGLAEHADFGIAIGGLAVGEEKNAMFDTIEYCDSLLPKDRPRYLMGVGRPTDIVKSIRSGVDMFDCVMPTRNGRNGQIFTSNGTIYKNAYADELLFISSGEGVLETNFGKLNLIFGDYIVIPRGVIWRIKVLYPLKMLIIESHGPIETPERYRNKFGQLLEHAPFSERDIITPEYQNPISEKSAVVNVKYKEIIQSYEYENHPFDLVGWDGYFYPWKLNIKDFMPITGKIHQPPPVHQTFQSKGFVVCSFVPRIFDYHEESIPAPYAHSNLDSEEIIYYVEGDFMSRKDIEPESITYHPMGLTHGPQPGKIEQSIGAKSTEEFAVMIDTFKPLNLTEDTQSIEDKEYVFSWRNKNDL